MKTVRRTLNQLPTAAFGLLDAASFFASTGFARLWRTVGGREVFWVTEYQGRPIAVLPGVEFGRWPLRRFQAMPDGCYASVVILRESLVSRQEIIASTWEGISGHGYARAYLTDYCSEFGHPNRTRISEHNAPVVDISQPDWEPPDNRLVKQIEHAANLDLKVQLFDAKKHRSGFQRLVAATAARRGSQPKYVPAFFHALADLATEDRRIYWVYLEHEGEPVASHIHLILGDTLLNWQLFLDRRFSTLRATQYLIFEVARRMNRHGVRSMNLGVSPADAEGLIKFKQRWGGSDHKYHTLVAHSGIGRLL
jgi:hypothetical protein